MRSNRREKESRKQCDRSKTPTKITKKKAHKYTKRQSKRFRSQNSHSIYGAYHTDSHESRKKKKYTVICHLNSTGFLL